MPVLEVDPVIMKHGHAVQATTWAKEATQACKFGCRVMEMFDHLAAYNVVVRLVEQRRVGGEKRVIASHVVPILT